MRRNPLFNRRCNIADKQTDEAMEQLDLAIDYASELPTIKEVLIENATDKTALINTLYNLAQIEKILFKNIETKRRNLLAILQMQGGEDA